MCRASATRENKKPRCRECDKRPPRLLPELLDVARLWRGSSSQWRAGMALVGLDYPAVALVAGWLGVDMDARVFGHIRHLELLTLEEQRKRHDASANKNRDPGRRPGQ